MSKPFPNKTQARTCPSTLSTINQRPPNGSPPLPGALHGPPPPGANPVHALAQGPVSSSAQMKMTGQHVGHEPPPAISLTRTAAPPATQQETENPFSQNGTKSCFKVITQTPQIHSFAKVGEVPRERRQTISLSFS